MTDLAVAQQTRYENEGYGVTYTLLQNLFTPYKFAGKHGYYSDGDSGMELLGHRYYLPILGRFLTQDPKGHEAGLNLYEYADNNPLVKIDPDGEDGLDWLQGVADVVGMIPIANIPAEVLSGGISLYKGDRIGAGLSLAGLVPGAGDVAVAAKIARRAEKLIELAKVAKNARNEIRAAERIEGGLKIGERITEKNAVERLKRGADTYTHARSKAKQLQKKASGGALDEAAHGPGYHDHMHGKDRQGGHAFYGLPQP